MVQYESKNEALISKKHFAQRMLWHVVMAFALVIVVIVVGIFGHMHFEGKSLHDATLSTTMLLGGLGVPEIPNTTGGKIFFSIYGLMTGLFFIATVSVLLAPIIHRMMHHFHLDED